MQTYQTKRKSVSARTARPQAQPVTADEMRHLSNAGAPQPMSPALREKFEPGFSADFSNIRISRGHIPEEMGVQAVARGTDILLDSSAGMDVLGHELAHVVQQAQGRVQGGYPVVENAALEHEADVMGARVASGLTAQAGPQNGFGGELTTIAPMSGASAPAQCKTKEEKEAEKHRKAATKASSGMKSKRVTTTPYALGPDTQLKVQQNAGGVPLPAAAMQAAKDAGKEQQDIFQASGIRNNAKESSKAIKERKGSLFAGLAEDMRDWGMSLQSKGLDWRKVKTDSQDGKNVWGGSTFHYSEDISKLSTGAMDIFDQYLDRPEMKQFMQDRYSLLGGTNVFDEGEGNGTQLDYMMTDIMNREFGVDAFTELRTAAGGDNWEGAQTGVKATNSFLTRLPNLVRDIEGGRIDPSTIPAHMLQAIDRYKQMRGKIGQMVAPNSYDSATGARAQAAPGPSLEPKPGQQYTTQADLPQSGDGWSHTGSWKHTNIGYNNVDDRMDIMPGGSDASGFSSFTGVEPSAPKKKKGLFSRLFGR